MAYAQYSDERQSWYYKAASTFGTPNSLSGSGWKTVKFARSEYPTLGVQGVQLDLNRASRIPAITDRFIDNFSGPFDVPFSMLLTMDRVSDFLYGVLQNRVSQGSASVYQKVFKPHASQPDFTANGGYFFDLVHAPADFSSGDSTLYTSCIIKSLRFEFLKTGQGVSNIVKVSGVITAKERAIEQTFTGTATAPDTSLLVRPYAFTTNVLTIGTSGGDVEITDCNWRTFSIDIDNGARPENKDSNGNPVTFTLDPGLGLKASLSVLYDTNTKSAINAAVNGSTVSFSLSKGSTGVNGYFNVTMKGQIENDPRSTEDRMMAVPINLQLADSTAAAADALIFTIGDSISQ